MPKSIDECTYFTKRSLDNGYVIAWVFKGEDVLNVKYKCPNCGYEGELQQKFKRPIRFKCEKCGRSFLLSRLRGKSKRLA